MKILMEITFSGEGHGGGKGHDTRPRIRENLWCFVFLRTLKIV